MDHKSHAVLFPSQELRLPATREEEWISVLVMEMATY